MAGQLGQGLAGMLGDLGVTSGDAALGLTGLSGLAGLFPTPTNTSGTSSQTSTTNLQALSSLLAQLSGTQQTTVGRNIQDLINKAAASSAGQVTNSTNLAPYAAEQTQGINQQAQAQQKAVENIMASRGLATSPVSATAATNVENQRQGQITQLNEGLPLLQSQLAQQALQGANSTISTAPRGVSTSQTSSQSGSQNQYGGNQTNTVSQQQTQAGGGAGGLFGGIGSMLATLFA